VLSGSLPDPSKRCGGDGRGSVTAWRGKELLPGEENFPETEYLGSAEPALKSALCGYPRL